MNNINGVKKILEEILMDMYPKIVEIQIGSSVLDDTNVYNVYLGFKSDDFKGLKFEEFNDIRKDTRRLAKYVLDRNERIEGIITYEYRD
jgi:hypothetical protein